MHLPKSQKIVPWEKNDEDFLIGTRWSLEIMTFCSRQAIIIFRDNLSW